MKQERHSVTAMLLTAMMIKAIISGANSPDPFDPVQQMILEMDVIQSSSRIE